MGKNLMFLVLVAVYGVSTQSLGIGFDEPKGKDWRVYNSTPWKEACTESHAEERNAIIKATSCGEPQSTYVSLFPHLQPYELMGKYMAKNGRFPLFQQITPFEVMAKRCVGVCDFQREGSCHPTKLRILHVQVKIYNTRTNKEACALFNFIEHVACACRLDDDIDADLLYATTPPNYEDIP